MNQRTSDQAWTLRRGLMRLSNPWLELIGERLTTDNCTELDYWRIERADSAIVVPIWRQQMVLPAPSYRPGIQEVALDFPGGRIQLDQSALEAANQILQRELKIEPDQIESVTALNQVGWPINSSLSNQRLYGFWAKLSDDSNVAAGHGQQVYPLTAAGVTQLLEALPCLQCRAVLMSLPQLKR